MRRWLAAAAVALAFLPGRHAVAAAPTRADVALVLAVDVSGSINDARFTLQREGIAAALGSNALAAAVASGGDQAIEIAVVEWAEEQHVVMPWTILRGPADLAAFAARLRRAPRAWVHTRTNPAGGIAAADALFATAPLPAERKVIDVSGDGAQNTGTVTTAAARDAAVAHGVTINGLPITSGKEPHVDAWYRRNVIGGGGAFLIVANGFDTFAEAFQQKVTREVAERASLTRLAAAH